MARTGKTPRRRIALVICLAAAFAALSPCAPAANADVLEGLTRPVEEVVTPVVAATPTVQQVGETVTTTAQEATAKIAPSAAKGAAAATSTPAGMAAASTEPADPSTGAAEAVTDRVRKLVGDHEVAAAVESAAAAVTKTAEAAVPAATAGAEEATGATLPDPSVPSTNADPGGPGAGASPGAGAESVTGAAYSSPVPTDLPPAAPRTTYVPSPREDGSTGAPLPRYVAFVWPAVALAGPSLAHFGESWGQAIERLATGPSAVNGENGGEGGVAGVHASGGRAEGSSAPLFSTLPADVGHVFSNVPTPLFIYLGLLVLAVLAVTLGVKREMAAGRRPY